MSDIVFCDTHDILKIFHLLQYIAIFSTCKLGQNAPKFHSWSAFVRILRQNSLLLIGNIDAVYQST